MESYSQNNYMLENENKRYNNGDYRYQNDPNSLNYSSNTNEYNYYSNNIYDSYNQNQNQSYNNNYTTINETYSQSLGNSEKREENNISKTIDTLSNRYFSKVTVENIRQPKDILYMLDNFLSENNFPKNYKMNIERNRISFMLYEEDMAFKFTKFLNSIKNKNAVYADMNVHLSLTPNNNYNKQDGKKRRGLSIDSIQRLFNGLGAKKHERKNKINPNLDLGVSSPFLYPHEKKRQNHMKSNKANMSINEKLKDYNKFPIRVLDTDYSPLQNPIFRSVEKDRWISPSNFKV